MRIDQLIENRQLFIQWEKAELREVIQSSTAERVQFLFQKLSEKEWIDQLPLTEVAELGEKAFFIMPEDMPEEILNLLFNQIGERNPPSSTTAIPDLAFNENPKFFKRCMLHYQGINLPVEAKNTDLETLVCLEAALKIRSERPQAQSLNAIESYIREIRSLDSTSPKNSDLLLILFWECDLKLIELALRKHVKENGAEFVQKRLDSHVSAIGRMLNIVSFETSQSLFALFSELGLSISPMIYIPDGECDLLKTCSKWETLQYLLRDFSQEMKVQMLIQKAEILLYNFLSDTPDGMESLLLLLKDCQISIPPLMLYRRQEKSVIDEACSRGKRELLVILLRYCDDKTLHTILTTQNSVFRYTLDHCDRYCPNSGCAELIEEALAKLNGT